MFEELGFEELTPITASVVLGLVLGCAYGALAQRSALCLRRSLVGRWSDCLPALGAWAMALACAIAGTRLAVATDLISFEGAPISRVRRAGRFRAVGRRAIRRRNGADGRLRFAPYGAGRHR